MTLGRYLGPGEPLKELDSDIACKNLLYIHFFLCSHTAGYANTRTILTFLPQLFSLFLKIRKSAGKLVPLPGRPFIFLILPCNLIWHLSLTFHFLTSYCQSTQTVAVPSAGVVTTWLEPLSHVTFPLPSIFTNLYSMVVPAGTLTS